MLKREHSGGPGMADDKRAGRGPSGGPQREQTRDPVGRGCQADAGKTAFNDPSACANIPFGVTRREFVQAAGAAAVLLTVEPLGGCRRRESETDSARAPGQGVPGRTEGSAGFEKSYRDRWRWDGVYSGTHNINCGWQTACGWKIYVKDGVVVREEQTGHYPQANPGVPDFNPRGCQKGCSYSELMYNPARIKQPLKRNGPRGSGSWKPVSWDEALTDIADGIIDAVTRHGPDTVVIDLGTNIIGQTTMASALMFADAIDAVVLDMNTEIGDDQQGAVLTFGDVGGSRSPGDFFHSDLILIWSGNPVVTQIPNFHFITEARYHGATVVAICPDYSPSAIRADLWVPLKPGSDAALALSMVQVMIEEGIYKTEAVREQTDLPMLVRMDNGKLLRASDLEKHGSAETLYRWDLQRDRLRAVDVNDLALRGSVPALEGVFEVKTLQGPVRVQPVFERLKESLAQYMPEKASALCGVSPALIRKLARMLAGARAASNVASLALGKYYHGDLLMRAQILAFALAGHIGGKGTGYCSAGVLLADGQGPVILKGSRLVKEMFGKLVRERGLRLATGFLRGEDLRRNLQRLIGEEWVRSRAMSNSTLFWQLHGGLLEVSGRPCDPSVPRPIDEYLRESLDRNWQPLEPDPSKQPRVLFSVAGNLLRRVRMGDRLLKTLWPKLDLVVAMDVRMSSTAMHADYVLPVAGAYEKPNVIAMNSSVQVPFIHATEQAVPAVGESRDEWEIVCGIAGKVQERARARGVSVFIGRRGSERKLDAVHDVLTRNGAFGDKDAEKLSEVLVESSSNLSGVSWEKLKRDGFARFNRVGRFWPSWGQASDFERKETIAPYTWHTEKKKPWPTLSGRMQFYIDHDWYLEMDEALPRHKDPPKAGGEYPLILGGGHTRWSIHALWRSDPMLLRLQRGEPCLWISRRDAGERGIGEGNHIEVFNDVGRFVTKARISPALQPGQLILYHAWEDYQFKKWESPRSVMASPLKPLELLGDYPFLKPSMAFMQPGMSDRDTRVEVRKL